jgi:serine/threonine protein kinase
MIGNYKVIKSLGEGGFGRTYLAEHTILKKKVVIKQSHFKSLKAQEMTINEASILWDLNHWALPTVKDVLVSDDGSILMVMSFVSGKELYKYVSENGPLDAETVCWITQRILSALYYLHFRGVVHRDIKPANIIVNFEDHIATLVDFGLSKLKPDGSPDPSGYTPYFGSPEQVQGKAPIPQSDIYSLGMTMLYILGGDITIKTFPALPEQLKSYISLMIEDDPLKRPDNCKDLNERLSKLREELFKRKHTNEI